ncbi:hypothetical protein [Leifsonia shinshuensis]|uniref:hypothetical protein n=1 Tax=Leifsonia shinshuensis TaxID=150026 RepID=UPI002864FC6E|nr:hypothetical protein [Leifsonia shinshuensis]MDR6969758.1 hypothetical protein [Leifsonia shinshuensis]
MTGASSKKPWWILTSSRAGSWWLAIFYTALAYIEPLLALGRGDWWWWLIGVFFVVTAAVAWVSLVWVLRHPTAGVSTPSRASDPDDG